MPFNARPPKHIAVPTVLMGNTNTSLVNQASAASTCCLVIEPQSMFPRGNRGLVDTTKPPGLNVDDVLWAEVVETIDPLARRLNTGFCTALVLYIAIIGAFVGCGRSYRTIQRRRALSLFDSGVGIDTALHWHARIHLRGTKSEGRQSNQATDGRVEVSLREWRWRIFSGLPAEAHGHVQAKACAIGTSPRIRADCIRY